MFEHVDKIVIKNDVQADKKVCQKQRSQCRTTHKRKDC